MREIKSYFPIKIRYKDTGEIKVIQTPNEIVSGATFVVIETNTK